MNAPIAIKKIIELRIPIGGTVEVESTGYCGGDGGHGGYHEIVFRFPDEYSINGIIEEEMIKISAKGDWELGALIRFFQEAANQLEQISKEMSQEISQE